MWDIILWILSILLAGYFIFSSVFVLIMAADLQADYINPIEMANKTNMMWWPDFVLFSLLSAAILLTGHWIVFLCHVPILAMNIYLYVLQQHLVNELQILQGDSLKRVQQKAAAKLGFAIISFFIYLFMLISTAISTSNRGKVN